MPLNFEHDTLILDPGCIISLYASQKITEIFGAIPKPIATAAYTYKNEVLSIYGRADKEGKRNRERIILKPLIEDGSLTLSDIETEAEAESLVILAAKIKDQSEAITGAIAINRNWAVGVENTKVRLLLQELAPNLQLVCTLDLVKHWVDLNSPSLGVIAETLQNMRNRAIYMPPKNHPLYQWWHEHS